MNTCPSEADSDWDYKDVLRIEPCPKCFHECKSYGLFIRGGLSNMSQYVEDDSWVNVCTLYEGDLVDLIRNCCDQLDLVDAKEKLEKTFNQEEDS